MSKTLHNEAKTMRLELRDDKLSAWLTILDENKLSDEKEILDLIEIAGIKAGFEEALRYMRKHGLEKEYQTPFPVAMCVRVKGESKLNYYFDLEHAKSFGGTVDIAELTTLTCIEPGTVLADYSSNIFDRQGSIYDIYGNMLEDEDIDLDAMAQMAGNNVGFDRQHRQLIAESIGYPSIEENGKISLIDKLKVASSISNYEGYLRSPVDLEIAGNVESTRIVAGRNLLIRGDFCSGDVWCEGNLTVEGEIRDCSKGDIKVWGNLDAVGILRSKALCKGILAVSSRIQQSEVVADGGIVSPQAELVGGHLECSGDLELASLGNSSNMQTEVEITISPFHKAVLMQLTKELVHLKRDPEQNSGAIEAVNERIQTCETALDSELNVYLQKPAGSKSRMLVHRDVYPPANIRIFKHEYNITTHQMHLELWEKE